MKNIQGWAAAAAMIGVLGACSSDDTTTGTTGTGNTTSTTAGAGGSTSTTGTGTGGSSDDGGTCAPSSNPSACETCAFSKCMTETCACDSDTDCMGARNTYFMCLGGLDGGDMESCASTFATDSAGGAGKANDLATCMGDNCQDACQTH